MHTHTHYIDLIVVCSFLSWKNRNKLPLFVPLGAVAGLVVSFGVALCFLSVSLHNYPGGHALSQLHRLVDRDTELKMGETSP